ncbi:DoxX family membrane protein [Nonomuraea sp. NPDC005983]|uniref:DoxX family protein n=1 Tax=Nonomuraea sp. NPDC005983 TaxID=3155595 RepID=UPI0033B73BA0
MRQALRDLAALVARLGVGGIFFANGWTKLEVGLRATGEQFLSQGAPAPGAWATVTMLTELIGGALLIAGLAVPAIGLILFAEALAVFVVAPPLNPVSLNELILLGAASLLLAVVGAGRLSVDHMVVIRRRESAAASEFAADTEADAVIASLRDPDTPQLTAKTPSAQAEPSPPASDEAKPSRSGAGKASRARGSQEPGATPEDTAPRPRARPSGEEPAPAERPAPGDTLVAGRKKPASRGRRTSSGD